jgi:hypothetical protein
MFIGHLVPSTPTQYAASRKTHVASYETTRHDRLRSACRGSTYSVMCAKYHVPTRNVAIVCFT